MFEENYSQDKLRVFFRYLVHAASRVDKPKIVSKVVKTPELTASQRMELRLTNMTVDRKRELEDTVAMYYTKNKYLPFENRLKRIKKQYSIMRRSKKYGKKKMDKLKIALDSCDKLINHLKKGEGIK